MKQEHYNLIKLSIEFFELFPYSFDVDDISMEDFELSNMINNLIEYIKATNEIDMSKDEIELISRIKIELANLNINIFKTDKVYLERCNYEVIYQSEDTSWCLQYENDEEAKEEFNRLKKELEEL